MAAGAGLLGIREGVGSGLAGVDVDGDALGALPSAWTEAHAVSAIRPTIRAIAVFLISCLLRSGSMSRMLRLPDHGAFTGP
jgi:hypothetical protein